MSYTNNSIPQLKAIAPVLTVAYAGLLSLLIIIVIVGTQNDIPMARFTRDPAALLHAHPFIGILSNIGILFWCSAATVCFFVSVIQSKAGHVKVATFLLFSGLLTTVLLVDDLFMLHEAILPDYLHIPQKLVYAGYLALILVYLARFSGTILQTEYYSGYCVRLLWLVNTLRYDLAK